MNRTHSCLERLFRAAARSPQPLPAEAPFSLEAQVLTAWRAGLEEDRTLSLLPLFRAATAGACAIILVSAALTFRSWQDAPAPNELVIVDSAIQLTMMQ